MRARPNITGENDPLAGVATASEGRPVEISPSPATPNETPAQREVRRRAQLEALTSFLVRDALAQAGATGVAVDPAVIRAEVDFRLGLEEERQAQLREGGTGQHLLRAIAGRGGMRWEHVFRGGEFRDLAVEGFDARARRGGVRASGPRTWGGIAGVFNPEGQSPDEMLTSLQQDPEFAALTDLDLLNAAVGDAIQGPADVDAFPGTAELDALGIVPGTPWWQDRWAAPAAPVPGEAEGDVDESEPDEGDLSFDPDEFAQRLAQLPPGALYPVRESPAQRARRGARAVVSIDAAAFRQLWETQHPGEPLPWNAGRTANLRGVEAVDAYPVVTVNELGLVDVVDGRHRLALAAEHGLRIPVAVEPGVTLPAALTPQPYEAGAVAAEEFEQRTTPVPTSLDRVAGIEGTQAAVTQLRATTEGTVTRVPLKRFIQARVKAAAAAIGLARMNPADPQVRAYLTRVMLADVRSVLRVRRDAVGWYNLRVQQARQIVGLLYPELLTNDDAWFAFTYAVAVTSNGLRVTRNMELALQAYEHFRTHGQMPTTIGEGKHKATIDLALKDFNAEVRTRGSLAAYRAFLMTPTTASAVKALGYADTGELAETPLYGAASMGPKIGNGFFLNLNGVFTQLTMDQWWVRTWARYTGTLILRKATKVAANRARLRAGLTALTPTQRATLAGLIGRKAIPENATLSDAVLEAIARAIKKTTEDPRARARLSKGALDEVRRAGNIMAVNLVGERETPLGAQERAQMRAVATDVLAALQQEGHTDLTMADLQAILWYAEKELYDDYDENDQPDYANAAAQAVSARHVPAAAVEAARARGAAAAAQRAGAPRPGDAGQPGAAPASAPGRVAARPVAARAQQARLTARRNRTARRGRAGRDELYQRDEPGSYRLDVFGVPAGTVRPDDAYLAVAGDADAARALQRDAGIPGATFTTRTQLVTAGARALGASSVTRAADAAQALAYLARGAQERFDALVTDAAGVPLAVVGAFKGTIDATAVWANIILAEAIRIPGAASIWFAHNHPSGEATLSAADVAMAVELAGYFTDTSIAARGFLAIGAAGADGRHRYEQLDPAGVRTTGTADAAGAGVMVPVLERELVTTGKLAGPITSPAAAKTVVPPLAQGGFGVVLLDIKHQPIGFLPIDPAAAAAMRAPGRLDWFYRALSLSAPAAAIIATPPEHGAAAVNLARLLAARAVPVLDVVLASPQASPISTREALGGAELQVSGEFYQRELDGARDPWFYSRLRRAVEAATFDRATGAQWQGTIKNSKLGISLEEFAFAHVADLEAATVYTRAEVLEYLRANQAQVDWMVFDEAPIDPHKLHRMTEANWQAAVDARIEELEDNGEGPVLLSRDDVTVDENDGEFTAYLGRDDTPIAYGTDEDVVRAAAEAELARRNEQIDAAWRVDVGNEVDYDDAREQAEEALADERRLTQVRYNEPSLVLPGADPRSYREVLLSATNAGTTGFRALNRVENREVDQSLAPERAQLRSLPTDAERTTFLTNTLARLTAQLAPLDAGSQVIMRRQMAILEKLRAAGDYTYTYGAWSDGHVEYEDVENPIVRLRYNIRTLADGRRVLFLEELQPPDKEQFAKMPALFQKHWRDLGLKWALAQVAELGLDGLAWTPGAQQIARYDLSRQVSRLELMTTVEGDLFLSAMDLEGDVVLNRQVTEDTLQHWIGKEAAEKLRAAAPLDVAGLTVSEIKSQGRTEGWGLFLGDTRFDPITTYISERTAAAAAAAYVEQQRSIRVLEGAGLKVGGLGLARLYDVDLPTTLKKIPVVKKSGAPIGTVDLPNTRTRWRYDGPAIPIARLEADASDMGLQSMPAALQRQARDVAAEMRGGHTLADAMSRYGSIGLALWYGGEEVVVREGDTVPALLMTPALAAAVRGGQALFQGEPPGEPPPGWDAIEGDAAERAAALQPSAGLRGAFNPATNVIRLIAGQADLSTFLHEAGHYYLELLVDAALTVDTTAPAVTRESQQVVADAQTVLRWFGFQGTLAEWRTLSVDARREHHEQFARGFEAYLFEGRAPSEELRGAFARFRTWLLVVYFGKLLGRARVDRAAVERRLGVTVADDVRAVMDRLLASEHAIAAVEAESQVLPLFTDPATAGVDPLTFAAYRDIVEAASRAAREDVDRRLLTEWRREREAWWQNEREQVRAQVVAELSARPVFVAQSAIRTGKMPDGSIPPFGDGRPLKLSKNDLVRQFGADVLRRLPKPYLYTIEGGIPLETAAEIFGFPTADALVQALIVAPPLTRTIEAETDERMRQKHGDLLLEGMSLEDVAEGAVQEHRAKVIAAELQALTRGLAGATLPSPAAITAQAEARIRAMKVRELKPGLYLQAARRASRQAFEAFARNDRAAAVRAKHQELVSHALYRAAWLAKDRATLVRRNLLEYANSSARRGRIGRAGQDYLDQIDGFLDRYEFARVAQTVLDRRQALRAWVAKLERQGLPVDLPEETLDDARRINYLDLTVEELEGVYASVESIAHLARVKNKLLTAKRQREFKEATSELATSIRERGAARPKQLETRLPGLPAASKLLEGAVAAHRKLSSLAREMDGFADGGLAWEYLVRPMNEAADAEAQMNAEATAALYALFTRSYRPAERARWYEKRHIPALGAVTDPRASLSTVGRLMVAFNWGNETNRQRLRDGHGWTNDQVQAILDTLDHRDWQFVQAVFDYVNDTYWPLIKAKQERITGDRAREGGADADLHAVRGIHGGLLAAQVRGRARAESRRAPGCRRVDDAHPRRLRARDDAAAAYQGTRRGRGDAAGAARFRRAVRACRPGDSRPHAP